MDPIDEYGARRLQEFGCMKGLAAGLMDPIDEYGFRQLKTRVS